MVDVPYDLEQARVELVALLEQGIERAEYPGSQSHGIGSVLPKQVVQFIDALQTVEGAVLELQRRAVLVEEQCAEGSEYQLCRSKTLESEWLTSRSPASIAARISIEQLRSSLAQPLYLDSIDEIREILHAVLYGESLKLSKEAVSRLRAWRECCRGIEKTANMLAVDGCRYLACIYQVADDLDSTHETRMTNAMILCDEHGGLHFSDMRDAANALVGWGKRQLPREATATDDNTDWQPIGWAFEHIDLSDESKLRAFCLQWRAKYVNGVGPGGNERLIWRNLEHAIWNAMRLMSEAEVPSEPQLPIEGSPRKAILQSLDGVIAWCHEVQPPKPSGGRTVDREIHEARKLVAERWVDFSENYKSYGSRRKSFENFTPWAIEEYDDMPSDNPAELRAMVDAYRKTRAPNFPEE